jgi:tyrosyl-tRNA synthetase
MPTTPTVHQSPSSLADWSDCASIQKRMAESVEEMQRIAPEVGMAKHVLQYNSDRCKQALARAMRAALAGGESAAKAEAEARASEGYAKELSQLGIEHKMAEQTVMEWEASKLVWSTCQSLLAMQREMAKI